MPYQSKVAVKLYKILHWMTYLATFMIIIWVPLITCKDLKDTVYDFINVIVVINWEVCLQRD